MTASTGRRDDLDQAKGLAILLVVFGHLAAREAPIGVDWYEPLRQAVYLFHMPFFLYLSGLAAALSGAATLPPSGWRALARRRAARLLLPFLGFGLLILAGKLALAPHVYVDNVPENLLAGLDGLLRATGASPAASVWYLVAVFAFALATPLLWRLGGGVALISVALALFTWPAPALFYLDRLAGYFVFFAAGVLAGQAGAGWTAALDRHGLAFRTLFLTALAVAAGCGATHADKLALLLVGLAAMPALHGMVRAWPSEALLWLGRHSLPIYLLNTICIGLAKAALLPVLGWRAASFPLFAPLLMAAGIGGPVLLAAIWARAGGWFPARPASAGSR
jgi:fucose 4-O-acetylase-like acetyltransferase